MVDARGATVRGRTVLLVACGLACLVQVWWSWHTMGSPDDRCDFPEDCVTRYFPHVYEQLKALWAIGVVSGMALVVVTALTGATKATRVRVGVVGAVLSLWFFLTPILWFGVGYGRDEHPAQIDNLYRLGLLLVLVAVAAVVWELAGHSRQANSSLPAQEPARSWSAPRER